MIRRPRASPERTPSRPRAHLPPSHTLPPPPKKRATRSTTSAPLMLASSPVTRATPSAIRAPRIQQPTLTALRNSASRPSATSRVLRSHEPCSISQNLVISPPTQAVFFNRLLAGCSRRRGPQPWPGSLPSTGQRSGPVLGAQRSRIESETTCVWCAQDVLVFGTDYPYSSNNSTFHRRFVQAAANATFVSEAEEGGVFAWNSRRLLGRRLA